MADFKKIIRRGGAADPPPLSTFGILLCYILLKSILKLHVTKYRQGTFLWLQCQKNGLPLPAQNIIYPLLTTHIGYSVQYA